MKNWTRLNTLHTRLTLWYVALLAVTVLGFCLYLQFELELSLANQVDAGLQVAASQLLVDVDDSVDPPMLRPMSDSAVTQLMQSRFALRLVNESGEVVAEVGIFPEGIPVTPTRTGFTTAEAEGTTWRILTQRVETQTQQFDAWLQMAQSLNMVADTRSSVLRIILIGVPLVLIVAGLGGTFMATRALRPVDAITRTVQSINATDMTRRIPIQQTADEIGRLATTLNSMLDRLQFGFEKERRFTADASHELRTPLTAIKGQIGVTLARSRTPDEYEATLSQVQLETDRLIRLANDLLFLTRLDAAPAFIQPEPIDLSDLLSAAVDQIGLIAADKQIRVTTDFPEALPMLGYTDHLIRLFLNLLDNAVKYTPQGGAIHVTGSKTETDVQITIGDTGKGIPAEHLPHLFDRFYRAEADRKYSGGAGLGLAIAQQIVLEHGGRIGVESNVGQGTRVQVGLPVTPPSCR
ncbi:MAG: HAMP domain-containing protein [Anaerolineae bacterium]|nr:HAMP domain-containing protein [Anaerolineae bacterium]